MNIFDLGGVCESGLTGEKEDGYYCDNVGGILMVLGVKVVKLLLPTR